MRVLNCCSPPNTGLFFLIGRKGKGWEFNSIRRSGENEKNVGNLPAPAGFGSGYTRAGFRTSSLLRHYSAVARSFP